MLTAIEASIISSLPWVGVIAAALLVFVAFRGWRRSGRAYAATFMAVSILLLLALMLTIVETSFMRTSVQTADDGGVLVAFPPIVHVAKTLTSFFCFCTAIIGCVQYCFYQLRPVISDTTG